MRVPVAALVAVLLLGLWPFLYVIPLGPESRDAVMWITRGAPSSRGWVEWVFWSDHFIGYRPVTALSYTLDTAIGGWSPIPLRLTDLALHVVAAGLLFAVYRRLVPKASPWGGVAASAFFVLHPVTSLVVPHLARRGYPLATALSLLGLWVVLGPSRPWRPFVAALLLGLAALSNEGAYVAFPVAAALYAVREPDRGAFARAVAPAAVVGAALVTLRLAIVGGVGGYAVEDGAPWTSIVAATWKGLLGLEVMRSEVQALPDPLALVGLLVVCGGLAIPMLARRPLGEAGIASLVLWAWVVGLALVYAPQGVFFPRQLYVALAPFALLVGVAAAEGLSAGGIRGVSLLGAAGLATLCVARQSPVLRGPDPVQYASWRAHDRLLRDLDADLAAAPDGAVVHPVIPHHRRPEMDALRARDTEESRLSGRQALLWYEKTHRAKFGPAVLIRVDARAEGPAASLEDDGGPVVVLAEGAEVEAASNEARVDASGPRIRVRPDLTDDAGRPVVLYFHDGVAGRLVPIGGR